MRLRVMLAFVVLWSLLAVVPGSSVAQTEVSCADFDAWEWAQLVHDTAPTNLPALDPDGDGIACPELPRGGFAPAIWTDRIPAAVEEAQIIRLVDGDTLEVLLGGVSNRVRIYRADAPPGLAEGKPRFLHGFLTIGELNGTPGVTLAATAVKQSV